MSYQESNDDDSKINDILRKYGINTSIGESASERNIEENRKSKFEVLSDEESSESNSESPLSSLENAQIKTTKETTTNKPGTSKINKTNSSSNITSKQVVKTMRKRKGSDKNIEPKPPKIKKIKPDEYVKYIKAEIDYSLQSKSNMQDILNSINELGASYQFCKNSIKDSIMWKRSSEEYSKNNDGEVVLSPFEEQEEDAIIFVDGQFVIEGIQNDTLIAFATNMKFISQQRITLVIYKINDYLNDKPKKKSKRQSDVTKVTRTDLENVLAELQILLKWNSRLIDTSKELAMMVSNYTKAIAQTPYKLEKQERDNQLDKYLQGDNKNCVPVDKNGNGLHRLWKQQLMSFPLSSLETAEAICLKFPTYHSLAQSYNGEPGEELLLQDIPIRRGAGPFSNARNLGPELSKKIYHYVTSTDPKSLL